LNYKDLNKKQEREQPVEKAAIYHYFKPKRPVFGSRGHQVPFFKVFRCGYIDPSRNVIIVTQSA